MLHHSIASRAAACKSCFFISHNTWREHVPSTAYSGPHLEWRWYEAFLKSRRLPSLTLLVTDTFIFRITLVDRRKSDLLDAQVDWNYHDYVSRHGISCSIQKNKNQRKVKLEIRDVGYFWLYRVVLREASLRAGKKWGAECRWEKWNARVRNRKSKETQ